MSHIVDRMMYSGHVPWHGLGIALPEAASFDDICRLVFDWSVIERQPEVATDNGFVPCDGYKTRHRSDNGKFLCIVPETTSLVEYPEAFGIVTAAVADGDVKFITAGTLDEGRQGWVLAEIPSATFEVAGSEVKPYLLAYSSHDRSRGIGFQFTSTYVVCNNTLTSAVAENKGGVSLKIHHTKNASHRLATAKVLISNARRYFGQFNEQALWLVSQQMQAIELHEFLSDVFPTTTEQDEARKKYGVESANHASRYDVKQLFDGRQKAAACAPGTRWAALNAVTEYIDHHTRGRGQTTATVAENRFNRILNGAGAKLRERALAWLLRK